MPVNKQKLKSDIIRKAYADAEKDGKLPNKTMIAAKIGMPYRIFKKIYEGDKLVEMTDLDLICAWLGKNPKEYIL
jgi:hypothetical protein